MFTIFTVNVTENISKYILVNILGNITVLHIRSYIVFTLHAHRYFTVYNYSFAALYLSFHLNDAIIAMCIIMLQPCCRSAYEKGNLTTA